MTIFSVSIFNTIRYIWSISLKAWYLPVAASNHEFSFRFTPTLLVAHYSFHNHCSKLDEHYKMMITYNIKKIRYRIIRTVVKLLNILNCFISELILFLSIYGTRVRY